MSSSIKDLLDYNIVKKCNKCGIVQIITNFYFRKDTNKYRNCCRSCTYERDKINKENKREEIKIYQKNYQQLNKERLSLKQKEYNERNKEKIYKKNKEWRNNNIEKVKEYGKNYFQTNKKEIIEKRRYRRSTIPECKLAHNLRSRFHNTLKSQNKKKINKTFELIGCSQQFLRNWIEFQLFGDMKIENYGVDFVWDHCLPIASFNLFNEDELRKCFNWKNLRPIRPKENMSKGDKVDQRLYLLQEIKAHYFLKLNGETTTTD